MKITARRTELADAARWVARAIKPNPNIPVLAGMIIEAGTEHVALSAFNYESSHRASVDVEVGEPGEILVPGHAVAAFLAATRGVMVELEVEGTELVIRSGVTSARFRTLDLADYPELPAVSASASVTTTGQALADAVTRLAPMSSRDPGAQLWEEAVHLLGVNDGLQVSTGSKYAQARTLVPGDARRPFEALVPTRMLVDAARDIGGELGLATDGGRVSLVTGDREATIGLFDAEHPGVHIDAMFDHPVKMTSTIDREALGSALKLIATASDRVLLEFGPDELVLTSYAPKKGEQTATTTDVIGAESDGSATVIAALEFLAPIVAGLTAERIELRTSSRRLMVSLRDDRSRFVFMAISPKES